MLKWWVCCSTSLRIWKSGEGDAGLGFSREQFCGLLEGGGEGERYFPGAGFLKIFLKWFDTCTTNQSDKTSGVVATFLNKSYLEYWFDFLKGFSQAVYPRIPDTGVMRGRPLIWDPAGVLIGVHARLCVSSVFHMFVIDSQKSKSKRLF